MWLSAVNLAVRAFHHLREELEADGLVISIGRTGFVVSNAEAKRLLKDALPGDGPKIHDVMRDLGCDCTSGRLRRVMTHDHEKPSQVAWVGT